MKSLDHILFDHEVYQAHRVPDIVTFIAIDEGEMTIHLRDELEASGYTVHNYTEVNGVKYYPIS